MIPVLYPEQIADLAARCGVKGSAAALAEFATLVRDAEPMAPEDMRPAPVAVAEETALAPTADVIGYVEPGHVEELRKNLREGCYMKVYAVPFSEASGRPTVPLYGTDAAPEAPDSEQQASETPGGAWDGAKEMAARRVEANCLGFKEHDAQLVKLAADIRAMPYRAPAPSRDAAPAGPALREFTRAVVERLGWTINGTFVVTKSGDNLHTADAIAFVSAALAQQTAAHPTNPKE